MQQVSPTLNIEDAVSHLEATPKRSGSSVVVRLPRDWMDRRVTVVLHSDRGPAP